MTRYNFQNLYHSRIKDRILLNKKGSIKETYQVILDIKGALLSYKPGDSLAVMPENDPYLVDLAIKNMHSSPHELIKYKASTFSLKDLLTKKLNITQITLKFLKLLFEKSTDLHKRTALEKILKENPSYIENHELWDTLQEFYDPNINAQEICNTLLPLLPRLYSISSAYSINKDQIELTVSRVCYETSNIKRYGVASNYLCKLASTVGIYIHPSQKFHLPSDYIPIIMIGAGTGIAPYRSFMLDRYYRKAQGKNWLFFGECNRAFDFYYEDLWNTLQNEHFLKVTTAFSRDQKEKIYVQDKLLENSKELISWLDNGSNLYICGDAKKMAKDLNFALIKIVQKEKKFSEKEAKAYIDKLSFEKRYLKDIY